MQTNSHLRSNLTVTKFVYDYLKFNFIQYKLAKQVITIQQLSKNPPLLSASTRAVHHLFKVRASPTTPTTDK